MSPPVRPPETLSRTRIGNLEFIREDHRLSFRFHRRFVLKALLILGPAAAGCGAALAFGSWHLLGGHFEAFTVDILFCVLGGGLLPVVARGLVHVARYGRGWFVIDLRAGTFAEPGWRAVRRTIGLDSINAVLIEKKRSSDSEGESESDLVALRLRGEEKLYFPWGRFGGPDRPASAAGEIAGFLGLQATDPSRRVECPN